MKTEKIASSLIDILPERTSAPSMSMPDKKDEINKCAEGIKARQDARELAQLKYAEKRRLKAAEAKQEKLNAVAAELGVDPLDNGIGSTENQMRKIAEHKKRIEMIEEIEANTVDPLSIKEVASKKSAGSSVIQNALALQGTSRAELTKLLTSLNINLSIQLSKQDTANLLACLLTCNESQLVALQSNKKVPIAIKAIIKRLQEDAKLGNIDTIEKLWDRIFGKGAMQLNLPEQQQLQTGIIPNQPISREAYILIRDTLIK